MSYNKKDFSVPQRMSKSAFLIFFINALKSYFSIFFIIVLMKIFNSKDEKSFWGIVMMIFTAMAVFTVLGLVHAFLIYYFRKFYVENGNLVFIHGFIHRETETIPLDKIHSLRTKRGFMYRLLDMRGVSFDTLASKAEDIELILDDEDWNILFEHIEIGEKKSEEQEIEENNEKISNENILKSKCNNLNYSNLNLIKGALCQNHLKGMTILLGLIVILYNKITSVSNSATTELIDYIDKHSGDLSFSIIDVVYIVLAVYVIIMALWVGKVVLRYFNMIVQTDKGQLFFESGLISRFSSRFSYDKVCTIYIKRNIIEKTLGCCTIMLKQALNVTEKGNGDCDVKIYGSNSEEHFLCWWLGDGYASSSEIVSAKSGNGLLGYTMRYDLLISLSVVIVLCCYDLYVWLIVPVIYMTVSFIKGIMAVNRSSIILKDSYLEIHNGRFADIRNYIKYGNIEAIRLVRTPFTPLFRRVNLIVATNGTSFVVRSLKENEAKVIYELLLCKQ